MLDGVRKTAEWMADTLEHQADAGEQAIARDRRARPRAVTGDDTIRFICSRLCCRSTDLVNARLARRPAAALATLRGISSTGILQEWPDHTPALFVNPGILKLWAGEERRPRRGRRPAS